MAAPTGVRAIENVALADGTGTDVLLDGDRVAAVGPGVAAGVPGPRDRQAMDGQGGLLLADLGDSGGRAGGRSSSRNLVVPLCMARRRVNTTGA
jgi:hypothetical protein